MKTRRWHRIRMLIPALALGSLLLAGCARHRETGALCVQVTDGWTGAAIENARVVIPEAGGVCTTDCNGRTEPIPVPILRDDRYRGVCPQDWGTVTVLVYAEGYYACALFHARVEPDAVRKDLPIRLFRGDGTLDTPFSLIESPDNDWVARLLSRYGP